MKLLVLGSNGFIGASVVRELHAHHDVYAGTVEPDDGDHQIKINLTDIASVHAALDRVQPEVILNCAGIVDNSEKAQLNVTFTTNLLEAALASGLAFKRIVITGSAGEYGVVKPGELPVSEDTPLRADSHYGRSKIEEEAVAQKYRDQHKLPVVVARLFNPIGAGMNPGMLIPNLLRQISELEAGERESIEVGRLDAKRDYVAVRDIASAYRAISEGEPKHAVYNIGSGVATSNRELVELILKNSKLSSEPRLVETSPNPEPLLANQADISRLKHDLEWSPRHTLAETVKEIFDAETRKN